MERAARNQKTAWLEMRLEPEVKKRAEQLFYNCGITMSGAISLFLKQSLNANGLPFTISEKAPKDSPDETAQQSNII